jgi:hypothetical protein
VLDKPYFLASSDADTSLRLPKFNAVTLPPKAFAPIKFQVLGRLQP